MSAQEQEVFNLKIMTPEMEVFSGSIKKIAAETEAGVIEILPRHEPLLCPLNVGLMAVLKEEDTDETLFAIHGGFLEINAEGAMILADAAEVSSEIDLDRAKASQERAKEKLELNKDSEEVDEERAQKALFRSIARINAAQGTFLSS
ncbi:MAG: ATP synthase F1 subunit epsilon [Planctomycetota bacterium]|jgi:F-type H+-transporting ATPase subunit epsilon